MKNEEQKMLKKLIERVAMFEYLDRDIADFIKINNALPPEEKLEEVRKIKNAIKRLMADSPALNISNRMLSNKIKMIRDNHGYNIDRIYDWIEKSTGLKFSQEAEEEIDWIDALFTHGTADYIDTEYFIRKNKAGAIVVNQSLPEHLLHHLRNLQEAYSLGLFEATVILSRSVIEVGVFTSLKRKGEIKTDENIVDIDEYRLKELMQRIKKHIKNKRIYDEARIVINSANSVLHSKKETKAVKEDEALHAIKISFKLLEELFG